MDDHPAPEVDLAEPSAAAKLDALSRAAGVPKIGEMVDGVILKVISRSGAIVDIGAACTAFLPAEEFGKKIKRPHKGYRLTFLEVLDVDLEAEEPRQILLGAEHCINLTPSPLLISPSSSCLVSPEMSRLPSPEPSRPPSPLLSALTSPAPSARNSPAPSRRTSPAPSRRTSPAPSRRTSPLPSRRSSPSQSRALSPVTSRQPSPVSSPLLLAEASVSEPEPLLLPLPAAHFLEHSPASAAAGPRAAARSARSAHRRPLLASIAEALPGSTGAQAPRASKARVEPLRQALIGRAGELGVRRAQLLPALRSLDILELRLAVAEKAVQLGIPMSRLEPILKTIDALGEAPAADLKGAPELESARSWHASSSSSRKAMVTASSAA